MPRPLHALLAPLLAAVLAAPAAAQEPPPTTGFEQRNGASFTTHEEELDFLAAVDAASERVAIDPIAETDGERPLHLVRLGAPAPADAEAARGRPTALLACSQHGNEPAGREACLKLIRDLAFTEDPARVALLERTTLLVIPSANPDGRARNSRGNASGVDVNRDHLGLHTTEAQAMAEVVRDWEPDVAIDLHEYGPSLPVLYDDAVLWLWPRNLNADPAVRELAIELGKDYLVPAAEAQGYTADEYGQYEVADNDVHQSAGDGDEGIMRNAMGLRHVVGILVETRVDADVRQSPFELLSEAQVARRRVASHGAVLDGTLRFLAERGDEAAAVTAAAAERKAAEGRDRSAPVFWGGADNQAPTAAQQTFPPPCGYALDAATVAALGPRLDLHGIRARLAGDGGAVVPMDQRAEPVIPLLLDQRGARRAASATPLDDCGEGPAARQAAPPPPARTPDRAAAACTKPRTVVLPVPAGARVTVAGRPVPVAGGAAAVRLTHPGQRLPVTIGGRTIVLRACG
jgi:hypothetical protein